MDPKRSFLTLLGAMALLTHHASHGIVLPAPEPNIRYVDWGSATFGPEGFAGGSIVLTNLATIQVSYSGEVAPPTQILEGTDYWSPSTPYLSTVISNLPPSADIIALVGGGAISNLVTFSEPVRDPVMLIVSLGQPGVPVNYEFDLPFEILSQGAGFFGDGPLFELDENVLQGEEGHGAIRFPGLVSSIAWTVPNPENWHGFTIGVPDQGAAPRVPETGSTLILTALGLIALWWSATRVLKAGA
jgi:hypothetical protein